MADFRQEFFRFATAHQALLFGEFVTKAGRRSPYFFNAGMFNTGTALVELCEFYVKALAAAGIDFDLIFGSAYKGIPLAAGVAMTLARAGRDVPFSFNRKEAKDHGEGGQVVGAALRGRVLIVDDVISAGTSVRESVDLIRANGATVAGVLIALDRMERGSGCRSAVDEVREDVDVPVVAIATLNDLLSFLELNPSLSAHLDAIRSYRQTYGAGEFL